MSQFSQGFLAPSAPPCNRLYAMDAAPALHSPSSFCARTHWINTSQRILPCSWRFLPSVPSSTHPIPICCLPTRLGAAYESPLTQADMELFGPTTQISIQALVEEGKLSQRGLRYHLRDASKSIAFQ